MIGALVAILSLNLTANLVGAGIVARTLPVTGATAGTPITVVSPGHNIPSARFAHGVVSGIGGVVGSTGTFQLNVVDEDTFTLWTYTQGGGRARCSPRASRSESAHRSCTSRSRSMVSERRLACTSRA